MALVLKKINFQLRDDAHHHRQAWHQPAPHPRINAGGTCALVWPRCSVNELQWKTMGADTPAGDGEV